MLKNLKDSKEFDIVNKIKSYRVVHIQEGRSSPKAKCTMLYVLQHMIYSNAKNKETLAAAMGRPTTLKGYG